MAGESNILFITRKWAPAVGGMETYSHRLAERLQAQAPTEVIALPGRHNGMPPTFFSLVGFMVRTFASLLVRRPAPTVVHLGDMVLWPLGFAARLQSENTHVVLSAHGTDVAYHRRGGLKGRLYGAYMRIGSALLRTATVIANSEATREVAAETGWNDAIVVPLATDIAGNPPTGAHRGRLLFAGRLVERKGCGWFIREVLPLLPDSIDLTVIGTKWDPAESTALDDPRVEFAGSLNGQALIDAYRDALCVIVPNIEPNSGEYEGFGLVATEAAAAGGVVLAARTGGLCQAVDDGVTGLLVPPGDKAAWRDAILEVSGWKTAKRKTRIAASMARCRQHFTWDRVARDTLAAYSLAQTDCRAGGAAGFR